MNDWFNILKPQKQRPRPKRKQKSKQRRRTFDWTFVFFCDLWFKKKPSLLIEMTQFHLLITIVL